MSRTPLWPLSTPRQAENRVRKVGGPSARPEHSPGGRSLVVWATAVVALLAVAATWAVSEHLGMTGLNFPLFTTFLVVAAVSSSLRVGTGQDQVTFSFTGVVIIAAIPLLGPIGAALLGLGAALLDARQGWWRESIFNGCMLALGGGVAALVYHECQGVFLTGRETMVGATPAALAARIGGPLMLADVALIVVNLTIIVVMTLFDPRGAGPWAVAKVALQTVPTYLAWGIVAFVVVVLWSPGELGGLALALVLVPLVVTRNIHALFSAERRTRTRIVEALAISAGDSSGAGHVDRLLALSEEMAGLVGMRPAERIALLEAARLHAVGRRGPCRPDADDPDGRREALSAALASHVVVGRLDFLDHAAETIRHQAEWFDGTGGPDGLAGEAIPRAARVLAVADALAVLTVGSRALPLREAVARVRALAGTRFDPALVDVGAVAVATVTGAVPTADSPILARRRRRHPIPEGVR